jgi:hypothetical protein
VEWSGVWVLSCSVVPYPLLDYIGLLTMERRQWYKTLAILGILVIGEISRIAQAVSIEEDLTITGQEKDALEKLRGRVAAKVPHDYMKQDIYLIRWLRARNLDVNQAETMLIDNLKWRKENKMDTILKEDFTEFDREYPYQIRFRDKEGKPIITGNFGDWDLRKLAIAGKLPMLNRHIDRAFENATQSVRNLQGEGQLVAQFDFIINMENYNLQQQGCLQCLPFYLYLVNTYENHFPGHADKIMLINTPAIFELILTVLRPIMSPLTRQTLKVYNTNKQQWQAELLRIVDKDELPIEYGGTNEV